MVVMKEVFGFIKYDKKKEIIDFIPVMNRVTLPGWLSRHANSQPDNHTM